MAQGQPGKLPATLACRCAHRSRTSCRPCPAASAPAAAASAPALLAAAPGLHPAPAPAAAAAATAGPASGSAASCQTAATAPPPPHGTGSGWAGCGLRGGRQAGSKTCLVLASAASLPACRQSAQLQRKCACTTSTSVSIGSSGEAYPWGWRRRGCTAAARFPAARFPPGQTPGPQWAPRQQQWMHPVRSRFRCLQLLLCRGRRHARLPLLLASRAAAAAAQEAGRALPRGSVPEAAAWRREQPGLTPLGA